MKTQITLHERGQKPIMQGDTTIKDNKTLQIKENKGLDILCPECSNPFIISLQLFGAINETIACHVCKKEIAFIVDK